ncbi:MAG TPA: hypothetical protein VM618_00900 [Acidimicrobiia bacterium]|nr:hypothetical protein [Acidimicrobiia bacterium]
MYTFAIVALLALATIKLVDYLDDSIGGLDKIKGLLTFVVPIVAVFAIDYSMFPAWGVSVSEEWMGKLVTGFVVAGMTSPWRALFGYLTAGKAEDDESLRHHDHLRRAA